MQSEFFDNVRPIVLQLFQYKFYPQCRSHSITTWDVPQKGFKELYLAEGSFSFTLIQMAVSSETNDGFRFMWEKAIYLR